MRRRAFLVASTAGAAGFSFGASPLRARGEGSGAARSTGSTGTGSAGAAQQSTAQQATAKSTILFFLSGGASHIDLWDMKPKAPREYRGLFEPIPTSVPGVMLCEHLPLLARQAHHLALVNSICGTVSTNDHHAGYYYNQTGHVPDPTFLSLGNSRTPYPTDWPSMGAVVAAKRPPHPNLPNFVTLPHVEGAPAYTRPGQFAARLGVQYEPLFVEGSTTGPVRFEAPALVLREGTSHARLSNRTALLKEFDETRRDFDTSPRGELWTAQQRRALELLVSAKTTEAFDVSRESPETRARYGASMNGQSLLAARRLVEAGVPFVTVFWRGDPDRLNKKCASGGGWDTHGNNFGCLKEDLLPEFDQGFSALVEDLANRGLLDETLLLVSSEMGRKPKVGDPRSGGVKGAGRDHWTHCLTDVLAGGGIRGGVTYGSSDRFAEYPADKPLTPADITRTVFHAMGIHDLTVQDKEGRPIHLLDEGRPILDLL